MIAPGGWLGVLGGGQLGRMFCIEAHALGYRVAVLDPDPQSPAGAAADLQLRAAYDDPDALAQLATRCAAITTEFENVPAPSLDALARTRFVAPSGAAVAVAQDRRAEKRFLVDCGVEVAPHASIVDEVDLEAFSADLLPGILKVSRLGYDGKGQVRVASRADVRTAWHQVGRVPCVLERRLALAFEISVVCARAADGSSVRFPITENVHRDGILAVSISPSARATPLQCERAAAHAQTIAHRLDYVGVLCVEFFVLDDGRLLVNEIAPRPHNSGHWTIDACRTSQFEQQVRVLAGLPLGDPQPHSAAVMLNLLGDLWFDPGGAQREPDWPTVLALPGAKLHLYGKSQPRPGRKMGHVTCVAASAEAALDIARRTAVALGLPQP